MSLNEVLKRADSTRDQIHAEWLKAVQAIADKFQVEIATGHLSDTWQVSEPGKEEWFLEYDKPENETLADALEALMDLDAKTQEYGVGPSNMERFKPNAPANQYEKQAQDFLQKHGIKFRATLSDSKSPPWRAEFKGKAEPHHYRVTLSKERPNYRLYEEIAEQPRPSYRLTFDFWGSINDAEKGVETVTPYDVLACISSDASYAGMTFQDWCGEFGESEDSIKALQTFRRCSAFGKRLQAFFTQEELEALQEIQ